MQAFKLKRNERKTLFTRKNNERNKKRKRKHRHTDKQKNII
jgi:hypothetical protein